MSGVIGSKRGFSTKALVVMKVAGPMGKKCMIMIVSKILMTYSFALHIICKINDNFCNFSISFTQLVYFFHLDISCIL